MLITKTFSFDAAHHLPNYDGNCHRVHGHRWVCKLIISGEYDDKTHMICDFKKLKGLIEENVLSQLDHRNLNEIFEVPTAEDITVWIFEALSDDLEKVGLAIYSIELWETPDNSVVLNPFSEVEFELYDEEEENADHLRLLSGRACSFALACQSD